MASCWYDLHNEKVKTTFKGQPLRYAKDGFIETFCLQKDNKDKKHDENDSNVSRDN